MNANDADAVSTSAPTPPPVDADDRPDPLRGSLIAMGVTLALIIWGTSFWVAPTYDWLSEFFTFPGHPLLVLRRPSGLHLLMWHLRVFVLLVGAAAFAFPRLSPAARQLAAACIVGYFLRASVWCIGGNLLMCPADSAHHWCLADNVSRGQGPTLDYVASLFRIYPRWGMVDDWSMPLYSLSLGGVFAVLGNSLAVAKGATFAINLATIPALYWLAHRHYGPRVAGWTALALAVFPPHVLYASMLLKESLTVCCTVLATRALLWAWTTQKWLWPCAVAGVAIGLMVLTRRTCLAVAAAMVLFGLLTPTTARLRRVFVWGLAALLTIAPWAWVTYRDYGTPLYSYTNYFRYTPDWSVHFRDRGVPTLAGYLAHQPLVEIFHVKCVQAWIMVSHLWFVFTPILTLTYFTRVKRSGRSSLELLSLIVLAGFFAGTLVNIANFDQVNDFGRYFLVPMTLMLPTAIAGLIQLIDWLAARDVPERRTTLVAATLTASCLWGALGWTSNYRLLTDVWHLQLTKYMTAGQAIREDLPEEAIILTSQPWELHMFSDRRTVLLPRNLDPRRLREEADTYGVTHVMLESQFGLALGPIAEEFGIDLPPDFLRHQAGVFAIRPKPVPPPEPVE